MLEVKTAPPLRELLLGEAPTSVLRSLSFEELRSYLPALADLKMSPPAGRDTCGHKDNLEHSFKVLENAIRLEEEGPDLILRTAALLHDIGKPATRSYSGGRASFTMHETVGARMIPSVLKAEGYSKEEISLVVLLVSLHMRAFGFKYSVWTDSAVRRLVTDAGGWDNFAKLLKIFRSDLTTKNASHRRSVLAGIARLEEASRALIEKDARAARRPAINGNEVMEAFGLEPGPRLGRLMRFLNTDEGLSLTRDEALARLAAILEEEN